MSTVDELNVKITADSSEFDKSMKSAESSTDSFGSKVGSVAKTASVAFTAVATAVTAVGAKIVSSVLESYGEYEQLVGGVETLFDDSSAQLMEYANNAYKTAGLSANDYMETVTSFSASLIQSLEGDTEQAVEYADLAITDMSDNANKMGTSMESIQNAYQGFAKQNYTMLDNLKLGYGGTKEEMQRLIEDANELKVEQGELGDLTIDSYADIVEAIHLVQTEMGITGTTAEEAEDTIQGSINSTKAAWDNLITGLGDGNADIKKLCSNVIKEAKNVVKNVIPVIKQIASAIPELVDTIADELPELINDLLPTILDAVEDLFDSLVDALPNIVETIVNVLPSLIKTCVNLVKKLINSIDKIIAPLIDAIPDIVSTLMEEVIGELPSIVQDIGTLLGKLTSSIIEMLPDLFVEVVEAIPEILASALMGIGSAIVGIIEGLFDIDITPECDFDMTGVKEDWQTKLDETEAELESFEPIEIDYSTSLSSSGYTFDELESQITTAEEKITALLTTEFDNQNTEMLQNIEEVTYWKNQIATLYGEEVTIIDGYINQELGLLKLDKDQTYTELSEKNAQLQSYCDEEEELINEKYNNLENTIRAEALAYDWSSTELDEALTENENNRQTELDNIQAYRDEATTILNEKVLEEAGIFAQANADYNEYYNTQKELFDNGEIDLVTFKDNCASYWSEYAEDIDGSTLAAAGAFITYCDDVLASGGELSKEEQDTMNELLTFFDGLPQEYEDDAYAMMQSLIDPTTLKTPELKSAMENLGEEGLDGVKEVFGISGSGKSQEFEDIANECVMGFVNSVSSAGSLSKAIGAVKYLFQSGVLKEVCDLLGIHSPSTVFKGYGENSIQGFINGANSKQSNLYSTMSNLANQAKNGLNSQTSSSWSIGSNSIQGMINGANSQRWSLISTFRNMAYSAWSSVKSILGIHSPSTMFEELGYYSAEGYGVGFVETMSDVLKDITAQTADISSSVSFPTLDTSYSLATTSSVEFTNADENSLIAEQNSILKQLLNKDTTVTVSSIMSAQNRINRRTGQLVMA